MVSRCLASLRALAGSSGGKVHMWEREVRVIDEVWEGWLIEEVWHRWKEKVLAAAEEGIRRKK